ncbi:MAG: hypothetical protein ABL958_08025 [Bdellovibrionia bacterium]
MELTANNLATELGRFLTLLILYKKGELTRNQLLVFWMDFFRHWDNKIQLQPGYFYPMLSNLEDKGILKSNLEGRKKTYRISLDQVDAVKNYLDHSKRVFKNVINFQEND